MKKVDMSEKAISRRLHRVDQLRELTLSLLKAKKEYDARQAETKEKEIKNENNR